MFLYPSVTSKTSNKPMKIQNHPTSLRRHFAATATLVTALLAGFCAQASSGDWNVDASGDWGTAANWNPTAVPGTAAGDVVTLSYDLTAASIVTMDTTSRTVGSLTIGDPLTAFFGYTLAATNGAGLIFDNSASAATLTFPVADGVGNEISAPITLNGNLAVSASTPNTAINVLSGMIDDGASSYGITLDSPTSTGIIALTSSNTFNGGLTVNSGSVAVNNKDAFGTGNVTVNAGGQVQLNVTGPFTNAFSIAGIGFSEPTYFEQGAIRLNSKTVSGPITLTGYARVASYGLTGILQGNIGESGGPQSLELYNSTLNSTTITLSGTNTHSGGTTNKGVILIVTKNNALGTGTMTVVTNGTAAPTRLQLQGVTVANNITLKKGATSGSLGVLQADGSSLSTVSGSVTIDGFPTGGGHLAANGSAILRITGPIYHTNQIIIIRKGTNELGGGGLYSQLNHSEGMLRLVANNGICPTAILAQGVVASSTFDLNGFNQTLVGLTKNTGASVTTNSSGTTSTLTLSPAVSSTFGGQLRGNLHLIVGSGIETLTGVNDFTGTTVVSNGTLALSLTATLASPVIVVGSNGTFNVSALTSGLFSLAASQTLSNDTSTATLNGNIATGSGTVSLVNAGDNTPSFAVAGGTLTLAATTAFGVNNTGAALGAGSYKLISAAGGLVAGPVPASVAVGGSGLAPGTSASLGITADELYLVVSSSVNTNPPTLTNIVSGGSLNLSWPADHLGWRLESQTNPLNIGLSNNWVTVPGSTNMTSTNITINPADPAVFYRLVYP
jgi:autotransporter-associated beta strand protein